MAQLSQYEQGYGGGDKRKAVFSSPAVVRGLLGGALAAISANEHVLLGVVMVSKMACDNLWQSLVIWEVWRRRGNETGSIYRGQSG